MTIQGRIKAHSESYRTQYHFSPETGWMNDPNGLVYFEGEYHLFFQYHPHSTVWGPMHWGHAVSPDLLHWEELPIALYPDPIGTMFSGSAVVDQDNTSGLVPGGGLVAIYSYDDQSQGLAYSTDRGRTWLKYAGNPILSSPRADFRDPKVFWYAPASRWMMVISAHDRVKFYSSPNLIQWVLEGEFKTDLAAGGVWECPDLFPLELAGQTHWILIVSVNDGAVVGGSGTRYFVGDFDGKTFSARSNARWLDHGRDNYAGVTWNNTPDGKRILIGWMNNWKYANLIPTSKWRGTMTIPRLLELVDEDGPRLIQRPIDSLRALRGSPHEINDVTISGSRTLGQMPKPAELIAEFDLGSATEFGFRILKSGNRYTTIGYDTGREVLFVDRTRSGLVDFEASFAGVCRAPLAPLNRRITMHILVDRSSVEVFGNEGRAAITSQIFPDGDGQELELYADNGSACLRSLEVYPLSPVNAE